MAALFCIPLNTMERLIHVYTLTSMGRVLIYIYE